MPLHSTYSACEKLSNDLDNQFRDQISQLNDNDTFLLQSILIGRQSHESVRLKKLAKAGVLAMQLSLVLDDLYHKTAEVIRVEYDIKK